MPRTWRSCRVKEIVEARTAAIDLCMKGAVEPGWELYRSFLAALSTGSLSGDARALRVTQPTIGRHIDELEQVLGTVLFTRSQHGLQATDAAAALAPYAEA